jgi:hypothetical protein
MSQPPPQGKKIAVVVESEFVPHEIATYPNLSHPNP